MITVIKREIEVKKTKRISELPPCLKTMKQEKLSLREPFKLSLSNRELILQSEKINKLFYNKIPPQGC